MKWAWVIAVGTGLMMVVGTRADDAAKTDHDRLQGTWHLTSLEINKRPVPVENLKADKGVRVLTLVVKGDSYTFLLGENRLDMTFKMDPGETPRTLDLTVVRGPDKGKVYHGIYKLEGNTFTVCRHVEPDKERPTEFATMPNSGLMLGVWQREKPE